MNAIIIDVIDNFTVQTSNNNIIRVTIDVVVFVPLITVEMGDDCECHVSSVLNLSSVDNYVCVS